MGEHMMVKLPRVDWEWPEDLHPWETIEVRGWGPVNQWEWDRLQWWQSRGITEMDADVVLDLQREAAAEGIGMYNQYHPRREQNVEERETAGRANLMIRIARWTGFGAIGMSILVALLIIVMNRGGGDDDGSADPVEAVPAPTTAIEAETPAVTELVSEDGDADVEPESSRAEDAGGAAPGDDLVSDSDGAVTDDAADAGVEDGTDVDAGEGDAAHAGAHDGDQASPPGLAGPYTGTFLGPVSATQPDGVVGPGSTVDLEMDADGKVTGRVELGILWSGEGLICTPPPDELWGEVGPIDVSSGSGQAPVVLNRFFPACSGITTGDPVTVEAVFHVALEGDELVGGIEFSGVLGLPWEASPDF